MYELVANEHVTKHIYIEVAVLTTIKNKKNMIEHSFCYNYIYDLKYKI